MPKLSIIIPCYNEEAVIMESYKSTKTVLDTLSCETEIIYVNDGSLDRTYDMLNDIAANDNRVKVLHFSRNFGHQPAVTAGIHNCDADWAIIMDADLQDDMDAVDKMVEKYYEGCDIVYGVRSSREKDSFFKRFTAEGFYKITNSLGGEVVFNHADYRLMSRRALDALSEYSEVNLFLRGIVPMLGYKTDIVEYERGERFAGVSKYPLKKMLSFAGDGITSLSSKPIKFISFAGILSIFTAIVLLVVFIAGSFFAQTLWGWRILLFTIVLFGGLILLSIGIVGEYVGKSYIETKRRPLYFISEIIHD